jgi:membrane protease YdiL (CAAX protease family)
MQAYPAVIPYVRTGNAALWCAWISILLVSDIPNILWNIFQPVPNWLIFVKIGVVAAFLALSLAWYLLRPLWQFFLVLFVLLSGLQTSAWLGASGWWSALFGGNQALFVNGYSSILLRELILAMMLVALMVILFKRPAAFFLTKGELNAPLEPVRWLGIQSGERWKKFGLIFAGVMLVAGLIFVTLSAVPLLPKIDRLVPLLPFILLFAALNAAGEEFTFRAPLLATLHNVIGKQHVLGMTAIFFGSLHFFHGDPSGIPGFLLATFVAYLFGKSMLETGGIFWAWLMHFLADVPIFALIALSMV